MRSRDFRSEVRRVSKDHFAFIFEDKYLKKISLGQLDLDMNAARSFETSTTTGPATERHISGAYYLQQNSCENPTSRHGFAH